MSGPESKLSTFITKQTESFYQALCRKKTFVNDAELHGTEKLNRVLNVYDLTGLGIGATLGSGVYVLAGKVAKSITGPAVVLSFVLAAVVSSFSGVCYAEFAGRVPKAGSAYIYSYVAVGEFIAFVIGWNLLIEHTIGTASVAKATTNYLDSLLGDPQKNFMMKHFPMHMEFLGEYPDVASFIFVMAIALLVAWGVRKSSTLNNLFTTLNLLTVTIVIVSGFYLGKFSNWFIPKSEIPAGVDGGEGGFSPFGWTGIVAGAARCFYAFIGFDSIATTGEETRNPKRTIPLAIVLSLFFVTLAYSGVASVLTLMWPYYDQVRIKSSLRVIEFIYQKLGLPVIKYMVTCGAIFALLTTLVGTLFPLPRILYAMASDGLLFKFLSKINDKTKTPFIATVICGISAGILSTIFNLDQLVDMASIGTLISYMIVCVCILILRYKNNTDQRKVTAETFVEDKWFNFSNARTPTDQTQRMSRVLILVYTVAAFVFSFCSVNLGLYKDVFRLSLTIATYVSCGVLFVTMLLLYRLPQAAEQLSFKVPLVPFVPCVSILLNIYLMMELNIKTWIRFCLWLVVGLFIYAFYGVRNSVESIKQRALKDIKNEPEIF
ncbi:Cationic amino acid transporter, C-terminal,Amino acid/polyamine transporter I [Cinara cedri]|uniref:Cationic amino acid transporter, C-terminal,Amino acid/polyamine transporter I n=1 Tax=Cinara cedri TaxID=506608 RepID=A0A5E4MN98_9HEMI|nr:Cationic amino acid transporter, C-terminal,Amino acid/polyamine transporter I [Cinara cedri]